MTKKLSIIIPVYNVEKYLERCIRSIVTQHVPASSYELITVNDGSTDGSREVLARLQAEYPFIRIIDKENGGAASARNAGIRQATGEYFFFIDADDWIADDALSFLLEWMEKFPVDVLLFGACKVYDSGKRMSWSSNLAPNNQVISVENYLLRYTPRSSPCISLFADRLFQQCHISMKEGFLYEDNDFIVKIFSVANQIVCNNKVIYCYHQRPESMTRNSDNVHNEKGINDWVQILVDLTVYIRQFQGKRKQGLERKLNFLAVDIVLLLVKKNMPSKMIDRILDKLRNIGYYPIPKASYSLKYSLFRILFYYPFAVKWGRRLRNYLWS